MKYTVKEDIRKPVCHPGFLVQLWSTEAKLSPDHKCLMTSGPYETLDIAIKIVEMYIENGKATSGQIFDLPNPVVCLRRGEKR